MIRYRDAEWLQRRGTIAAALDGLTERIEQRVPNFVSRSETSTNSDKPLDMTRVFAIRDSKDSDIVFSTMFSYFGGALRIHADLMREDGPIISDMGSLNLGSNPSAGAIDESVDAIAAFVARLEDVIVTVLSEDSA